MNKAVITADIIHSTRIANPEKLWLYQSIQDVLNTTNRDFKMTSEMYRGDSFQCLVENPKDAIRIALILKNYIKSLNPSELSDMSFRNNPRKQKSIYTTVWMFDVRMAIGIGNVEAEMKTIVTSDGEAFQLSGRVLDEMKNSRSRFSISSSDKYKDELLVESSLLDAIITKNTALQSEVIYLKLLGYTEIEIAKRLDIQQSAVNQRSVKGNWNVINKMVEHFERIYGNG